VTSEWACLLLYHSGTADDVPLALLRFKGLFALRWGPPNDELRGYLTPPRPNHPVEVVNSPWILELECANGPHDRHVPDWFAGLRHFVIPFHDTTFECLADGYVVALRHAPIHEALPDLARDVLS